VKAFRENDARSKVLSVRLSIEALEAIDKAAVDAKTTRSAYAARVLKEAATGKAPAEPKPGAQRQAELPPAPPVIAKGIVLSDPKALDELRRIGVNINQIAHALNAGRPTRDGTLASAARDLFKLLKDPDAFMDAVGKIHDATRHAPQSVPERLPALPSTAPMRAVPPPPRVAPPVTRPPLPSPVPQPMPSPPQTETPMPRHVVTPPALRPVSGDELEKAVKALAAGKASVVSPAPSATAPAEAAPLKPRRHRPAPVRRNAPRPDAPSPTLVLAPPQRPAPTLTAPIAQPVTKEERRDSPHPQTRHQLQDRAPLRPARPGPAEDRKPGRLGFLSKLWGR
jgi:hypothetical protein